MALIVHSMSLRNLRRKVRICSVWVLAVCFALLAPSPILSSAWSAFPCEDVDNNGFCVPGVDRRACAGPIEAWNPPALVAVRVSRRFIRVAGGDAPSERTGDGAMPRASSPRAHEP